MTDAPTRRSLPRSLLCGLWRIARGVVFVLGVIVLVVLVLSYVAFRHLRTEAAKPLPSQFTLAINLTHAPPDAPAPPAWLQLGEAQHTSLVRTIEAIDRASHDDRVKRIVIELGGGCCSLTSAEELHNAIERFRRRTGRKVVARAMSFDGITGLGAYVVATAASRIELSAAGDFGVSGIALQTPFAGKLLTTVGIDAQYEHIGKYKTYPQMFTRSQPTKANTEMLNSLAGSLYASALAPIAARLKQTPDQVKALLDQAPLSAGQAKQDHLIDQVLPLDARISHIGGAVAHLADYVADAPKPAAGATRVALIIAHGDIEAPSATGNAGSIDPRRLAGEISRAIDDKSVEAIVLRLDTPGGTVTGSALVGAEVARAATAHKPLIVSMGGTDASGGYWISSHGAVLVADPATLTGSIGVLGGKLSFAGLLDRIGVTVTGASRGTNALFDSPTVPWTQPQLQNLQGMLNLDYQQFVGWVAAGRHMSAAQVNAVGQGRVWTGVQAKTRGLVDRIGGYHEAFAAVRAALKLPVHAPLDIIDGNAAPGIHTLIAHLVKSANPLATAEIPVSLRALLALGHLHRLSMPPIVID